MHEIDERIREQVIEQSIDYFKKESAFSKNQICYENSQICYENILIIVGNIIILINFIHRFHQLDDYHICKIIVRLLLASASSIKNVKRIKLNSDNILLFDYLKYVEINR